MSIFELALDAMDSRLVLAVAAAVDLFVALILVALVCHVVMIPVRKTAFGQWAGIHAEVLGDRFRAAYAARKSARTDAQ